MKISTIASYHDFALRADLCISILPTVLACADYSCAMWRLVKYLEENQLSLIENVDARADTDPELAERLSEIRPGGAKDSAELANAVLTALWLGRRAQVMKESGDKSAEQFFREAVLMAFETGRRSAITAP
jgi:hypothetical protein